MIRSAAIFLLLFCCKVLLCQKHNLLPDTIGLCLGDSASIEIKYHFDHNASITWYTPQGIISNTKKVKVVRPGRYLLKIHSSHQPTYLFDSSFVRVYERPLRYLNDTLLCKGRGAVLDAKNAGMKYLWNTGETTQKIKVETPGRFWVKINNGSCSVVDTVNVKFQNTTIFSNNEMTFCLNEENKVINIKQGPGTKILWNTGATTPGIYVTREGVYSVRTENNYCGSQIDSVRVKFKACECEMLIPNSFTPNEDNRNDYFFPVVQCDYSFFSMTISDRWGNAVFSSNNLNAKWDGRYKGNPCPEDIYVFRIESNEKGSDKKQVRNGHISLFR